jgi:hypothetical protein
VLLRLPMGEALKVIHLPEKTRMALEGEWGPYSAWLQLARASDEMLDESLEDLASSCGVSTLDVNRAHLEAIAWANQVVAQQ